MWECRKQKTYATFCAMVSFGSIVVPFVSSQSIASVVLPLADVTYEHWWKAEVVE